MARRRTVTDAPRGPRRVRATVVEPGESHDRVRNAVDAIREVAGIVREFMPAPREDNPDQTDDEFLESGPEDTVVWPEIADQIDTEKYLETVDEIAELGHRLDGEDSPDADRFLAAQHYLMLLEDGADDFDEEYVLRTWRTWVERAKQKAPEFEESIEDFLL